MLRKEMDCLLLSPTTPTSFSIPSSDRDLEPRDLGTSETSPQLSEPTSLLLGGCKGSYACGKGDV